MRKCEAAKQQAFKDTAHLPVGAQLEAAFQAQRRVDKLCSDLAFVERMRPSNIRPFDSSGANAAFDAIDYTPCKGNGGGYGRANVTFNPDGRVVEVDFDSPSEWAPRTLACVRDRLVAVRLREYSGPGTVTVSAPFFVKYK